jgi:chromosomal replication initiator protein
LPAVHARELVEKALSHAGYTRRGDRGRDRRAVARSARGAHPCALELTLGENNRLLSGAVDEVCRDPGRGLNPLVLFGTGGVGKSHVLGVVADRLRATGLRRVEITDAGSFARDLGRAIRTRTTEAFRARYRGAEALLLDDAQDLLGKDATQVEFLHTFEALFNAGRQIVVASSRSPRQLVELHPGLRGRLLMGLCVAVDPPAEQTRRRILRQEAEAEGVSLVEPVVEYLAGALGGSICGLVEAVRRLKGMDGGERRNVAGVRAALTDLLAPAAKNARRAERRVIEEVADATGVAVHDILGSGRRRQVAEARQVAMYLARRQAGLTLAECGRVFQRSPSTIAFAERKIDRLLAIDPHIRALVESCQAALS